MTAAQAPRMFRYNNIELEDPGPEHDAVDVRNLYSATYPEIVSAAIEGPELKDGKRVYTFRRAVGTKGNDVRAQLADMAEGKARRPRGNAVLAAEHAAAAPFASACRDLVNGTLFNPGETYPFDTAERDGEPAPVIAAPCEALPPLP